MRKILKKYKDKLFFLLVEKNQNILEAYQQYKWSITGNENKIKSWTYIFLLNMQHRVLKIDNSSVVERGVRITSSGTKVKLPYLKGPESTAAQRPTPTFLARKLMSYDIISFDIFDTLLLRPFASPDDLFLILGDKLNILNFKNIRKWAEKEARNRAQMTKGTHEVTIYDIYEFVEFRTGLKKEEGVRFEFETEMEFCFANPYMKEVYEILKSHNKKIIAVSDMYLPKDMILQLLHKNGFESITEVYVSCEYNGNKRSKKLFKEVLKLYDEGTKIVHVGDDYQADVVSGRESGIDTIHYKNVHHVGNKYRAEGMSEIISSTYAGIVNTHIHNGIKKYSPYYEYGFIYGGLYVLGYCRWIGEYVKTHNIDKVLFLSRDGDIYSKVFNVLYNDIPNEYVYWSRIANTKYTVEFNRNDFLNRMVTQKATNALKFTIKSLLLSLELEELLPLLPKYNLSETDIVSKNNEEILQRLFVDNWDVVVNLLTKDMDIVKEYFVQIIQNAKRIAIVDVGWLGSGGLGIKRLIEEKWKLDVEVKCLLAASRQTHHEANLSWLMKKDLEAYIFSRTFNRDLYNIHSNTNKRLNSIFFELFSQAKHPSFSGFQRTEDGDIKFVFDVPEVENYKIIDEIHEGIMDFVKKYTSTFGKYDYLLNIPGYDAYKPFSVIIWAPIYLKRLFGGFRYCRTVASDYSNQRIETIAEIMKKAGM